MTQGAPQRERVPPAPSPNRGAAHTMHDGERSSAPQGERRTQHQGIGLYRRCSWGLRGPLVAGRVCGGGAGPTALHLPLWRLAADIISAVVFDYDGLHLATGDRGGRVVLFERVAPNIVSVHRNHLRERAAKSSAKRQHAQASCFC